MFPAAGLAQGDLQSSSPSSSIKYDIWLVREISGSETYNVVRYGPRHVDLIRSWSLVASRHRNSILVSHVEQPRVGLVDLVHEDSAGLGLDAAVEVAGDVVRHRAVLAAVSLQAGLGPLQ